MESQLHIRTSPDTIEARVDSLVPAYRAHLFERGHPAPYVDMMARASAHLIVWMAACGMEISALDARGVDAFVRHDCTCPSSHRTALHAGSRSRANSFFGWLIRTGRVRVQPEIVAGGALADAFAADLVSRGHSERTARDHRMLCRHFIVWLHIADLPLERVCDDVFRRFREHDCGCAHPRFLNRPKRFFGTARVESMLSAFARFLIDRGVVAEWREPEPAAFRHPLLEAHVGWLRRHRGLRESTIAERERHLRILLPLLGDGTDGLDAALVRRVALDHARCDAQRVTALRHWLRFLAMKGLCPANLADAVPPVARHRPAQLPRFADEGTIEALIGSCDPTTPAGLRDRAIMLLLARLALRAGDVAELRFRDIDWTRSMIAVGGKGRQRDELPLPQDAGDAIMDYVRKARPRSGSDRVFLLTGPGRGELSGSAVSGAVRRAMKRVGLAGRGLQAARLFRHSRATHLLRGGTSLEGVSTLLRHRSISTTAIYARVDVPMLLEVAQPWPGDNS